MTYRTQAGTTPREQTLSVPTTTPPSLIERMGRYERTPAVIAAEVGAVIGLAGTAYIHLAEFSGKFSEVPYLGVGYALLSAACIGAIALIVARNKAGWYLGGAVAAATLIGFVLTRTVGLPASTDDIGNWSEPIGTWSLIFEGLTVALAAAMIGVYFRKPTPR
jgi:hypothetical protein